MHELSATDVCEITGLTPGQFRAWCEQGAARAVAGGTGHGNHRRFTVMQVVGIAVAVALRNSERGCALAYAARVVEGFGKMTEEDLIKKLEAGCTHMMCVVNTVNGGPFVVLDTPRYAEMVDVRAIYSRVKAKVEEIEASVKPNATGRNRGLVEKSV
jgi:hypothetical protein